MTHLGKVYSDLRFVCGRAMNIVPISIGAEKAVFVMVPPLKEKLTGGDFYLPILFKVPSKYLQAGANRALIIDPDIMCGITEGACETPDESFSVGCYQM